MLCQGFETLPFQVCCTHHQCFNEFLKNKKEFIFDETAIIKKNAFEKVGGFSSFYRNHAFNIGFPYEGRFLHLWCRFFLSGYQIKNINEVLVESKYCKKSQYYEEEFNIIWGMFRRKKFVYKPLVKLSSSASLDLF